MPPPTEERDRLGCLAGLARADNSSSVQWARPVGGFEQAAAISSASSLPLSLRSADSARCRPPFRDDLAHHSGMMSPGVTRPLLAPIRSRLSALRRETWMPTERLAMRHVRDVIRLKSAGMPTREIARRMPGKPPVGDDAQSHAAGHKLFVDYAGDSVPVVIDRLTGERAQRADLRRGARRIELHLRAGDLDAGLSLTPLGRPRRSICARERLNKRKSRRISRLLRHSIQDRRQHWLQRKYPH
ncbi:hypothetical protein ACVIHH_004487 [Bradyrhizobium sp. USDA 4518]